MTDAPEAPEDIYEAIAQSMRDDYPKECAEVTAAKVAEVHSQISRSGPRFSSIINEEIARRLRSTLNMPEPYDIGEV